MGRRRLIDPGRGRAARRVRRRGGRSGPPTAGDDGFDAAARRGDLDDVGGSWPIDTAAVAGRGALGGRHREPYRSPSACEGLGIVAAEPGTDVVVAGVGGDEFGATVKGCGRCPTPAATEWTRLGAGGGDEVNNGPT